MGNLRTKEEMTRLRIIQINDENKKLAESIISSLECLKEAGTRIKLKAKEKIKEFVYSLHSEEAASKLIRIGDLSVYLSK